MTDQELFDKVATHLLTQGKKAQDLVPVICRYKTDDGLKCAVGCLIPDELYSTDLEGCALCQPHDDFGKVDRLKRVLITVGIASQQFNMLAELQNIHDYQDAESWRFRLGDFARHHKLKEDILCS
jgi:hypothetical protein